MRRFLASTSNCAAASAPMLLALCLLSLMPDTGHGDPSGSVASIPATPAAAVPSAHECEAQHMVVYDIETDCVVSRTPEEIARARAYVIETASPGYTMTLQGPELAIGRLHPEFVVRLANAIREARDAGLPSAGVFSAYRPPAFGIGGFSDKFNSLHTYGLAVDMEGIGRAGSSEAQLWHKIAARNGVVCPYGPRDRAEWNHCQPTSVKIILAAHPLRDTVSAGGPFDLATMFEVGNAMIESVAAAVDSLSRSEPTPARVLEAAATGGEREARPAAYRKTKRTWRATTTRAAAKSARHSKIAAARGTGRTKAKAAVHEKAKVAAHGKAKVAAHGKAKVAAHGKAKIAALGKAKVAAHGKAKVAVEAGRRKSKSKDG